MLSLRMVERSFSCRSFTPILIGFCVGISISLIVTNARIENGCPEKSSVLFGDIFDKSRKIESLFTEDNRYLPDENTEDLSDYEPRINLAGKPHSAKKEPQTLTRPRYFSTELGIKDKNFVAILSSIKNIPALGLTINETLAHHVNRLAFFVEVAGSDKLDVKTLPIVGFKDSQQGLLTLHTLKYLSDKLAVGYSYFLIIKDTTYVDGRKLENLTNHISITENVYMGLPGTNPTSNPSVCSLDSGILVSSSVLFAISPLLETCTEEFAFNSDDEKIGLCIFKALNITCQTNVHGHSFTTFNLDAHISDVRQLEKVWESSPDMTNALTFFPARDSAYFFMLNKLSCNVALRNINLSIRELESSILRSAPSAPGGLESVTWPFGYSPPSKQDTRFSVLNWEYFNETHIFFDTEHSVVKPLSGPHLEDIQEIISAALANVLKESPELNYLRVVNGYKRFDPTRGMDYIVDLLFADSAKGKITIRMEACRPITHIDTVPMPYVTESSVVHIVVVLREEDEVAAAEKFLDSYAKNMMAKSDKSELTLVLFNQNVEHFKALAQTLNAQHKKQGSKISILSSKLSGSSWSRLDFVAADLISSKLGPGTLLFICNPFTEIYADVLNRVRINTISGWQLFSPIPFAEYNPDVSFPGLPKNEVLNISTNQGLYDIHDTQHISFYMADYLTARKTFEMEQPLVKPDQDTLDEFETPYESILTMFVRMRQLHVLRAVEPHLRIRYHERRCETKRCRESFLLSQGTRSQLAQFALDRESPALAE